MKAYEYRYLAFRRIMVFFDEWLSYSLLIYLYYFIGEKRLEILSPIVVLIICFNLNGYYHLGLLEQKFKIYVIDKM